MLHRRPIAGLAAAVVVVSGGLASVATGASAATVKVHTPKCFGKPATIVVTGNNKTVHAPKGKLHKAGSVIVALGKGDKVYGGDGNDKICVGNAKLVNAGKGDDNVQFTTGTIHGNDGNDLLQQVGKGNATVYGDAGNDKIKLAKGNSTANGGDGNDSLSAGGSGTQKLNGNAGTDTFFSGGATATIDGGAGDDSVTVHGADAAHTFVVPGAGDKVNGQYVRVDASKDTTNATLSYNGYSAPVAYTVTSLPGDVLGGGSSLDIPESLAPVGRRIVAWSINFGDGSPVLSGQGAPPSDTPHAYLTDGGHPVTVSLTDSTGKVATRGIAVYSAKAPTATLSQTTTGAITTFALTAAADPGASAISAYSLDFGDGSEPQTGPGAPAATYSHTYAPGYYSARLTVIDDHGNPATSSYVSVAVDDTASGNPAASIILTKQVSLTGAVASTPVYVTVGGAAAHTAEIGQDISYRVESSESADPGYSVTTETLDLGDGRGAKTLNSPTVDTLPSTSTGYFQGGVVYNTPGPKTIVYSVTETGTDGSGNPLPPRTTTTTQVINVLAGQLTAQLSVPDGPEGTFTGLTAGSAAPAGAAITFYELTGPNGFDQIGAGAPPAAIIQALAPVSGVFTLTLRDSLGNTTSAYSRATVTADHPLAADTGGGAYRYDSGVTGWVGVTAGQAGDDQTAGEYFSAELLPSFGSRITRASLTYGDGGSVVNPSGSLSGDIETPSAHVYTAPGEYTVTSTVVDSFKKSASDTLHVSVGGQPTLAVSAAPVAAGAPSTVTTAPGYGVNAIPLAYTVHYDDSTPDAGGYGPVPTSFTHVFTTSGSHRVTVSIVNDHGGYVSTSADVTIS